MGSREFFKDIPCSLNGKNYGQLAERKISSAVMYVSGLVVLAFIFMCILGIPNLLSFGDYIDDQMQKVDKIQIDGRVLMNEPIVYPEYDPLIAIDATNNTKKVEARKILITQEYFYWKTFTGEVKKVKMADWLRNPESKKAISFFIFVFALLVLPGFLFWWLVLILLKYLFIITLFAGIFFIILDLTKYRMSFKKMWNICAYASTLLIFIEVIFIPIGTDYLIPLFSIFWGSMHFYLVTLVLYLSLVIIAILFAEHEGEGTYSKPSRKEEKKQEKSKITEEITFRKKHHEEDEDIELDEYGNRKKGSGGFTNWESPIEKF